ncbi:MAG: hypothetical protein ACQCN6_03760 [Candidatus Bathyarchaeia archaeon]|jgi:hypothetical protein
MADKTGKPWMAAGETDDPDAVIESYVADGAITKGSPVELTGDGKVTATPTTWYGFGIATKTVADGEEASILRRGRVKVVANGATTAVGVAVRNGGNGKVTELNDQAVDEGGAATYTIYLSRKLGTSLNKADADGDLIFIQAGD